MQQNRARTVMTKQDIIDQIKEIVEFGALIDKIEASIKEEQA